MKCPKNMNNGPCGGVMQDDYCEILPETRCIWVKAWQKMEDENVLTTQMFDIQAPTDHRLEDANSQILE